MPPTAFVSPQHRQLWLAWPKTAAAIEATYCPSRSYALTRDGHRNDAGYILWAIGEMAARATALRPHDPWPLSVIDRAAANEIHYHWRRQTAFRRPVPALVTCLLRLPAERPEKLHLAARRMTCPRGNAATPISAVLHTSAMAIPWSSPTTTRQPTPPYRTSYVSPASTPQNSAPRYNQVRLRPEPHSPAWYQTELSRSSQLATGQTPTAG